MNIGFIGFGNMAQAMVQGFLEYGKMDKNQFYACAKNYDKLLGNANKYGIHACKDSKEVVNHSDIIILAVKPYLIEEVVKVIAEELDHKMVISVAAGFTFDMYEKILKPTTAHISTIPNTPISVGEGIVVCENKHSLNEEQLNIFMNLFKNVALVEMVDTHLLSIGGTIGGCTPAYAAMFIEALGDAGVKHGLPRKTAYQLAAKMLVGTGKLYLKEQKHPGEMKDAVCSPKGTTIKGVAALERNGFRNAIIEAIDAAEGKL